LTVDISSNGRSVPIISTEGLGMICAGALILGIILMIPYGITLSTCKSYCEDFQLPLMYTINISLIIGSIIGMISLFLYIMIRNNEVKKLD